MEIEASRARFVQRADGTPPASCSQARPNLRNMGRPRFTAADRAAALLAWQEARAAGEDQQTFCARQSPPISARTLRQWSEHLSSKSKSAAIEQKIDLALQTLEQMLDVLKAVEAMLRTNTSDADGVPSASASASPASAFVSVSSTPTGTPPAAEAEPVAASSGSSPSCRSSFGWDQ